MQELRLYRYGITPKIRFATIEATKEFFDNGNNYDRYSIDGCIITQGTGYVDFNINKPFVSSLKYSCILVENDSEDGNTFIAFVDRIEYNNFNEDKPFVRLYFTIDWWSTLHYNNIRLSEHVEGDVIRAHVNNFTKINGQIKPTLEYTTPTIEEKTERFIKETRRIQLNDGMQGITFTYIIFSQHHINTAFSGWSIINHFDRLTTPPFGIAVVPTQFGIVQPYKMSLYSSEHTGEGTVSDEGGYPIGSLTDDSIIAMFDSSIPPIPIDNITRQDITSVGKNALYFDLSNLQPKPSVAHIKMSNKHNVAWLSNYSSFNIDIKSEVNKIVGNRISFLFFSDSYSIPTTYKQWVGLDPKLCSYYYTPVSLEYKNESVVLDNIAMLSTTLYLQNVMESGGCAVFTPTLYNPYYEKGNVYVGEYSLYKPIQTIDDMAVLSSIVGVGQSFTGGVSSTLQGFKAKSSKSPPNRVALGASIANSSLSNQQAVLDVMKIREGAVNPIAPTTPFNYLNDTMNIVVYTPSNQEQIAKHLAMYGYATYLHPHEILLKHRRKYFNYIITSNCEITLNSLSQQAREHIEAMFNNGVWLWQTTDSFGNFEVPNYPIIMED